MADINPAYQYDLLNLKPLGSSLVDDSQRHNTTVLGGVLDVDSDDNKSGAAVVFNGYTQIAVSDREADWVLGATILADGYDLDHVWPYFNCLPDNHCTIDCWVKPVTGGGRYYPICSSFSRIEQSFSTSVMMGWCLQIDTQTGHLQMVDYALGTHVTATGSNINLLMESSFVVPMNQWSHIAVMSWKVTGQNPRLSVKRLFLNGVPDNNAFGNGEHRIVWSNAGGNQKWFLRGDGAIYWQFGPLVIGGGKVLDLPGGGGTPLFFRGKMDTFRIAVGPRFRTDGGTFVPDGAGESSTTQTTTTQTTQSTTQTTQTAQTTTATTVTQTTPPPIVPIITPVVERDLLVCKFSGSFRDDSSRHTILNQGALASDQSISGYGSVHFDGKSYIEVPGNLEDWYLGSSLKTSGMVVTGWAPAFGNNHFTIDCWVKPETGGQRYYPICSSFAKIWQAAGNFALNSGWSFQIDTQTGKLQMIGYFLGNADKLVLESTFIVPLGSWTHVAVMAWRHPVDPTKSYACFFKDGVPNSGAEPGQQPPANLKFAALRDYLVWTNGMSWESKYGSAGSNFSTQLYIGLGPKTKLTDPNATDGETFTVAGAYKFVGNIDFLRICNGPRFSIEGNSFTPPKSDSATTQTTTGSTTNSTTRSTTNSTTNSTTQTTTTTTTMSTTLTTSLPPISIDDRLVVRFVGDVSDMTKRHVPTVIGNVTLQDSLGAPGGYFDGRSYVKWDLNLIDFAFGAEPIVLPQTQSTTTTTGSTTTTQTTGSQTTQAPVTLNPNYKYDLLSLGVVGTTLIDRAERHNLNSVGGILQLDSEDKKVGTSSIVFDGSSVIDVSQNERDWMLGSTKVPSYDYLHGYPYFNALPDSDFTIDCWVKPELGGRRYYPICSSFARVPSNNVMVGWSFQIDRTTGRLQMVGYGIGSHFTTSGTGINLLIESSFQISFGEWTHVAVMSWKVSGQAPRLSMKNLFKNGVPDNPNGLGGLGIVWCNQGGANPVVMSEAYTADDRNLGPLSVGSALVLSLPDGNGSNFQFFGKMDGLRISLGPRFRTDGGSFVPEVVAPTTTTQTTTQTVTQTTLTTTQTTTTQAPQVVRPNVIRELIFLGFDNTLNDSTQRHAVAGSNSITFSTESKRGAGSAVFNGKNTWIQYSGNIDDWILGATPANPWGPDYTYYTTLNDNNFTLDCWIYPEAGGDWRYYGICGSFDHMGYLYSGWFLWLDTVTGKLQMMQHYFGDWKGQSIESADAVPMNTWTHVAISSWKVPANFLADEQYDPKLLKRSRKAIYINGQVSNNGEASSPAYTGGPLVGQKTDPISSQYIIWAGRTFHGGTMRVADFYVGTGGKSQFSGYAGTPEKLLPKISHFFKGKIDGIRICEGNRYPLSSDYKPIPFDPKDY
jgi:hypothetical protein